MITVNADWQKSKDVVRQVITQTRFNLVGIGVTAFNRIGPALIADNFEIICHKTSTDLPYLRKQAKVTTIAESWPENLWQTRMNTLAILKHEGVQSYLKSLGKVGIFVYKTSERVDAICEQNNWQLVGNSSTIRDKYENKKLFREIGKRIGMDLIAGETLMIGALDEARFLQFQQALGEKLVLQLTELSKGGGAGTFFVNNLEDLSRFKKVVKEKIEIEGKELREVNITRFVDGISGSITGCITHKGVLTTPVQTQVVDVPELVADRGKSGVFRGHDWSLYHYSEKIQMQASKLAERLGSEMAKDGYKGIFGIDLIIDRDNDMVFPVECNPRYTGAFPVYSLLQNELNEVPLDAFQLLEHLGIEYDFDLEVVNQSWKTPKHGAHLVLHNPDFDNWVKATGELRAGVLTLRHGQLEWLREGWQMTDLQADDEFILTDGCPAPGDLIKPHLRTGKLIFKGGVLEGRHDQLNDYARQVVKAVKKRFNFVRVEPPVDDWKVDHPNQE
jgi:hypothetical protein